MQVGFWKFGKIRSFCRAKASLLHDNEIPFVTTGIRPQQKERQRTIKNVIKGFIVIKLPYKASRASYVKSSCSTLLLRLEHGLLIQTRKSLESKL